MTKNLAGSFGDILGIAVLGKVTSDVSDRFIKPRKKRSKQYEFGSWF